MSERSPRTLLELLEVGASGRKAIQVPDGPYLTYDSLRHQVHNLARQLRSAGLGRDDRIIIVLPSGIEAVAVFLAVTTVGTAVPLNPGFTADEFHSFMEDTEHKALITMGNGSGSKVARGVTPGSTLQIDIEMDSDGVLKFTNLPDGEGREGVPPHPNDIALVLHTSGTTSKPKCVPLKHRNIVASTVNIKDCYRLTPEDVSLCIMPLFHVHGLVASVITTFLAGGTVVVPPKFNPMRLWPVVNEFNVSWFSAVPTLYRALLTRSHGLSSESAQHSPSMKFIRSCSAPLAAKMMTDIEERFGIPVLEAYGMTEAAHQMASNPLPPALRKPGSVGCGTGVEIAIMDEEGGLLSVGQRGEVVIQGPNVIDGYEDNPEANASSFTNGWFRTGDEGSLNDDGYLTLTGRIKEQINRSGEKISPQEIDELLLAHPAVGEAVCFGASNPTHGEEPEAAVVLNYDVTERDLVSYCRQHVAAYKVPRFIHIVPEIPKTATGKVQRRLVAEKILGTDSDERPRRNG